VFAEIQKDPENIQKTLEGRMSENIYHNLYTGNTINQLPDIYKKNPKLLATAETGKIYGPIEGNYTTIYQQTENTLTQGTGIALDGYTMFRLINKQEGKDISGNTATIYVFEDVFVQDRETRIPATDGQTILNGAYFKFANSSASEMGEPVVVINLDEK